MSTGLSSMDRQAHTSQSRMRHELLLVLDLLEFMLCISPSPTISLFRSIAWQGAEGGGENHSVRLTHSLLLQPGLVASRRSTTGSWLHRRPERDEALQTSVSVVCHFSRISPAHPRSLARCLSRALRHGAALLLRLSENLFGKSPHRTRTKRFSEPSAKAPLGTWERGTSRRFAQECPEGNPGKYKQGETQWHSTKTKSL